jgi:regulator of cell morphogenesis and NO signaling
MNHSSNLLITPDTGLPEILMSHPHAMLFFEHFGIQVPLKRKTISQICTELGIRTELFVAFTNLYIGNEPAADKGYKVSDIPVIIIFLKNSHRYYLNEIYPEIQMLTRQIQSLNDTDEIKLLEKFFNEYFSEVKEHLDYENDVVFPYITALHEHMSGESRNTLFTTYSVTEYKKHHSNIEEKLDDLMNLLISYLPLGKDQQVRRKLFLNLVELNYDLNVHARIEDLVLVPLAEKMERKLKGRS